MAIIRTASIVGAISGSLESVNFGRGIHGPFVRSRPVKCRRQTRKQTVTKSAYASAHHAWRSLTEVQRTGWRSAAAGYHFTNRLGVHSQLSGWQVYLKFYVYSTHFVFTPPVAPPTMKHQPGPLSVLLDLDHTGGNECTVERPASADTITWELQISRPFTSQPCRPGRTWLFVDMDVNFSVAIDIDDELAAACSPLIQGEVIWWRVRTGQPDVLPSPWLTDFATVA